MNTNENTQSGVIRDARGHVLVYRSNDGFWYEKTVDAQGNILTYKDSGGYSCEFTRDTLGNVLTYKHSSGYEYEYTRDSLGNELTYKNSRASYKVLAVSGEYTLYREVNTGQYWAGCRRFSTPDEALAHWNRKDERAMTFTSAILADLKEQHEDQRTA